MAENDTETPELESAPEADAQYAEAVQAMQLARRPKMRVRVVVQLYRFGKGQRYTNWRGVLWRLNLDPTLSSAANFRASLQTFFDAVSTIGPIKVMEVLTEACRHE